MYTTSPANSVRIPNSGTARIVIFRALVKSYDQKSHLIVRPLYPVRACINFGPVHRRFIANFLSFRKTSEGMSECRNAVCILPVILKPWFFFRSSILSIPSDGVDQQQQPCEVVLAQILTYKPGGNPEPGIKESRVLARTLQDKSKKHSPAKRLHYGYCDTTLVCRGNEDVVFSFYIFLFFPTILDPRSRLCRSPHIPTPGPCRFFRVVGGGGARSSISSFPSGKAGFFYSDAVLPFIENWFLAFEMPGAAVVPRQTFWPWGFPPPSLPNVMPNDDVSLGKNHGNGFSDAGDR